MAEPLRWVSNLGRALASLRLTYLILGLFILAALCAGLIPQGLPEAEYSSRWILVLGLDRFGRSPVLRILLVLFWTNLAACTLPRLGRTLRSRRFRRIGPDMTHIGLLILLAAAAFGAGGGVTEQAALKPGEGFTLAERRIFLEEIRRSRRGDSSMLIESVGLRLEEPGSRAEEVDLRVNRPYRFSSYRILLLGIEQGRALRLRARGGEELLFARGEGGTNGEIRFMVSAVDQTGAVVDLNGRERRLTPGDDLGGLTVLGTEEVERALLSVQSRRGGWILIAAGVLSALGGFISLLKREVQ